MAMAGSRPRPWRARGLASTAQGRRQVAQGSCSEAGRGAGARAAAPGERAARGLAEARGWGTA
jgi:hypothetical protein